MPVNLTARSAEVIINYNPLDHFSTKEARHLAAFVQYAVITSREAVAMAKLDLKNINLERMGVLIVSGIGCLHTLDRNTPGCVGTRAVQNFPVFSFPE